MGLVEGGLIVHYHRCLLRHLNIQYCLLKAILNAKWGILLLVNSWFRKRNVLVRVKQFPKLFFESQETI